MPLASKAHKVLGIIVLRDSVPIGSLAAVIRTRRVN